MDSNNSDLSDLLRLYYKLLFPYKQFYKWLSYGEADIFKRREFSFTLPGDIYIRYQSFADQLAFEKELQRKCPEKIDLGAVYNMPPNEGRKGLHEFIPRERELVFDIDINDYDDIRTCCTGTSMCPKCWPFLVVAAKILDKTLREDFGFKHLLFVFSGRRGIHCWVCDRRARVLNDRARSAIVSFISVVEGGAYQSKKVNLDGKKRLHPSIQRAVKIIDDHFDELIIEKQRIFHDEKSVKKCLAVCDESLRREIETRLNANRSALNGVNKWSSIVAIVKDCEKKGQKVSLRFYDELKLQLCYPRLDTNVSRSLNHLLKTPFSVHPKTGKVCVPIDISRIDSFDPFSVPSLNVLNDQINEFDANTKTASKKSVETVEKTKLKQHVEFFNKFVDDLSRSEKSQIKRKIDVLDF